MPLQRFFRPDYVNYLCNNIIIDNYLQKVFPVEEKQTQRLNGIYKPEGLEEKMLNTIKGGGKYEAAILLYEAYENIPPMLASQEPFWAYLTHVDLFNYVKAIWPEFAENNKGQKKSEKESVSYIKDHWFYSRGPMRTSLMNLWWSVYLTIDNDAGNEHKYDLTKVFFLNDGMRTRRLGTGQLGRNREALKGILSFMNDNLSLFDQGGIENRMIWITRHFNFIGGAKPLGCLPSDFFYKELQNNITHLQKIKERTDVQGPDAFI